MKKSHRRLRKCWAPHRSIIMAWKALKQRLSMNDKLREIRIQISENEARCPLCWQCPETNAQLLFECPFSSYIWSTLIRWLNVDGALHNNPGINFLHFGELVGKKKRHIKVVSTIWVGVVDCIWQTRNLLILKNIESDVQKLVVELKLKIKSWLAIHLPKAKECDCVDWLGDVRKIIVNE